MGDAVRLCGYIGCRKPLVIKLFKNMLNNEIN